MYLAIRALKAPKNSYSKLVIPEAECKNSETTFAKEFITGFMSGVLNPKNLLFYLSLFTVVLTKDVSLTFKLALGVWMTLVVFIWDLSIIYLLSTDNLRHKFSNLAYYIDKFTGAILGMIGFKIVKSALTRQ